MPSPRSVSLLLLLVTITALTFHAPASAASPKNLEIASPLKSLTIPDKDVAADPAPTHRSRFLPKFFAGLQAETELKRKLDERNKESLQSEASKSRGSSNWADSSSKAAQRRRVREAKLAERAFDKAAKQAEEQIESRREKAMSAALARSKTNKYQFVGVIDRSKHLRKKEDDTSSPITWYARPKPEGSKWSVRLVHVDRKSIVYDLFRRGKVDVTCEYKNTGKRASEESMKPVIENDYKIRQRNVMNLWGYSPKHHFTDSSGMFWRERRLRPGLYTDGENVFESSYRYRDGRNGMHRRSTLSQFLKSKSVSEKSKERILQRLQKDSPDVVLEEI